MSNWGKYGTSLVLALVFGACRLDAAPYQTVLLDARSWLDPQKQDTLLIVDMDTGTHTEVPVEIPYRGYEPTMAINSEGAIYVFYGNSGETIDNIGPASLLARLDPTLSDGLRHNCPVPLTSLAT